MVRKILTWFLYIFVFSFSCQLTYFPAMCDIIIKSDSSKQIAFAVGSDFVQTGCGTFLNPAYLILSNPFDACRIPKEPPSNKDCIDNNQWILLAIGNSSDALTSHKNCDFKTKFRNAADAGYSAIIIGSEDFHEEVVFPGLITEDDEEFIDVHLINPADIKPLSKYAYPKPFVVVPSSRHRCKEEYRKSWIRSRYLSHTLRQWKEIKQSISTNIKDASNLIIRAFTSHLSIVLRIVSDSTETLLYWSCVVVIPLSPVVLLVYLLLFSENYSYKSLSKGEKSRPYSAFPRGNQEESSIKQDRGTENSKTFTNKDQKKEYCDDFIKEGQKKEYCNGFSKEDNTKPKTVFNEHRKRSQSESQNIPPLRPPVKADYTLYHRINLGIKLNAMLTKADVNSAYRKFALKYHPDKHRQLNINEAAKITEEFRSKTKSRDVLLSYCTE